MAISGILPHRRAGDRVGKSVNLRHRGIDAYGSGFFGASRGKRTHNGIDYAAPETTKILSPVEGVVTKLGYPYANDLGYRYVQVTDSEGNDHRLFYVCPVVTLGDPVAWGAILGEAQNIAKRYDEFMMVNHIHYEIRTKEGKYIDPENS